MLTVLQIALHKIFFRFILQEITLQINTQIFLIQVVANLLQIGKNLSLATQRRTQTNNSRSRQMLDKQFMLVFHRTKFQRTILNKLKWHNRTPSLRQVDKDVGTLLCKILTKHRIAPYQNNSHHRLLNRSSSLRLNQVMKVTNSIVINQRQIAVRSLQLLKRSKAKLFPRPLNARN